MAAPLALASSYRSFIGSRKPARKSKGVKGITIKKKTAAAAATDDKKRKRTCDNAGSIGKQQSKIARQDRKSRDLISDCGSIDEYETLNTINSGSYGVVSRARHKRTGEIVAVKEELDGLSVSSMREIHILRSLHHPCIVDFKRVVVDDCDGVYIVMEYARNDLGRYLDSRKEPFKINEVKDLMIQILEGVNFLHEKGIMHRDLKPCNILISGDGWLKIGDFGLSRHTTTTGGSYTPRVVTRWYRAPELLLGEKAYSSSIDMWSVGCIMAELLTKEVLFRGQSEIDQLRKIYEVLGTPDEAIWPGFSRLPGNKVAFPRQPHNLIRQRFAHLLSGDGLDLLTKLLTYDPAKRITAEAALDHVWFD